MTDKTVPLSTLPRYERYGKQSHFAYAVGKLLTTVDFNVSDMRKWAVLDSEETGNFLVTDALMVDKTDAHEPLAVTP